MGLARSASYASRTAPLIERARIADESPEVARQMARHERELIDENARPFELLAIHILLDELDNQPASSRGSPMPRGWAPSGARPGRSARAARRSERNDLRETDREDRAADDEPARAECPGGRPGLECAIQVDGQQEAGRERDAQAADHAGREDISRKRQAGESASRRRGHAPDRRGRGARSGRSNAVCPRLPMMGGSCR